MKSVFFACFACCIVASCTYAQKHDEAQAFRLPEVPETLTKPEDRAAYLSLHYWDHFNFADTALISMPEITEQAFVDFISILPYTPKAQEAVDTLLHRSLARKEMFSHFVALAEKYLYEPNSPMHDEELHILVLRAIVGNPQIEGTHKIRPRRQLEMAMKNRRGEVAADFAVTCRDGKEKHLSDIKARYTLLFFNDPDCEDCLRVKKQLASSSVLNRMLKSGNMQLLSVCVEGRTAAWEKTTLPPGWIDGYDKWQRLTLEHVYDLKAMPTLYLLDAEKRVILKDTSVEQIEKIL